ncbi:hypothetical protein PG993_007319 [Apiospora rasikravindrae]|uniref:Uncharacterized protein n=1 Tax=Apiospora rasikravindrae TaxID=990691 RepID=A0ABR1SX67_9PEZI
MEALPLLEPNGIEDASFESAILTDANVSLFIGSPTRSWRPTLPTPNSLPLTGVPPRRRRFRPDDAVAELDLKMDHVYEYYGYEFMITNLMVTNLMLTLYLHGADTGASTDTKSFCQAAMAWNDEFQCKRSICLDEENLSYFEAERNPIEDEDIMDVLSRAYEVESDRWAYQLEPLQRLCEGLKLDMLTLATLDMEEPVALVFDRDGSGRRPMSNGPLTAGELYSLLRIPRFGVVAAPLAIEGECDISDALQIPCRVQAEQRIIYLADPDAHSLCVLAATASLQQVLPLLEFMAERLSSNPKFSIRLPPKGVAVFEMMFQLPFLVFRAVSSDDDSKGPLDGRSSCTDLSFLTFDSDFNGRNAETESHFLCQSTFSCFIHGWDFARWTAYGLFDTYFDKPNCRESAMQYFEDSKKTEPDFAGDPLTLAQEDLNKPVACPRHYFLRVLLSRMIRVRDEWGKVVKEVLEMMQIGQARCQVAFQPFRPDTTNTDLLLAAIDERQEKLTQVYQWNIKTRSLLIRLKRLLEKTVGSWQFFVLKDTRYLYQQGSPANVEPEAIRTLHSIDDLVSELECLHDELHHQVELFEKGCMQEYEQHSRDFHTFLAGQAERTAQAQQRTAQAQQTMSEDVRMFLPVLVAASICSTQTSPLIVFLVLLVTVVLAILALGALKNWKWCSRILKWIRGKVAIQRNAATIKHNDQPILPLSRFVINSITTETDQESMEAPAGAAPERL